MADAVWTVDELRAVVGAYLQMLELDKRNLPYVKADVRRALLGATCCGRHLNFFFERGNHGGAKPLTSFRHPCGAHGGILRRVGQPQKLCGFRQAILR
jgi:hypothetical protein